MINTNLFYGIEGWKIHFTIINSHGDSCESSQFVSWLHNDGDEDGGHFQFATLTARDVRVHNDFVFSNTAGESPVRFTIINSHMNLCKSLQLYFFSKLHHYRHKFFNSSTLTGGVISITIFNSFQYPQGFLLELQFTTLFYADLQHVRVR